MQAARTCPVGVLRHQQVGRRKNAHKIGKGSYYFRVIADTHALTSFCPMMFGAHGFFPDDYAKHSLAHVDIFAPHCDSDHPSAVGR